MLETTLDNLFIDACNALDEVRSYMRSNGYSEEQIEQIDNAILDMQSLREEV